MFYGILGPLGGSEIAFLVKKVVKKRQRRVYPPPLVSELRDIQNGMTASNNLKSLHALVPYNHAINRSFSYF